jgi:hypothetical protein
VCVRRLKCAQVAQPCRAGYTFSVRARGCGLWLSSTSGSSTQQSKHAHGGAQVEWSCLLLQQAHKNGNGNCVDAWSTPFCLSDYGCLFIGLCTCSCNRAASPHLVLIAPLPNPRASLYTEPGWPRNEPDEAACVEHQTDSTRSPVPAGQYSPRCRAT